MKAKYIIDNQKQKIAELEKKLKAVEKELGQAREKLYSDTYGRIQLLRENKFTQLCRRKGITNPMVNVWYEGILYQTFKWDGTMKQLQDVKKKNPGYGIFILDEFKNKHITLIDYDSDEKVKKGALI